MYKFGKIDETVITIFRVLNDKGNGFYRDGFDSYFPRPSTWWEKNDIQKEKQPHVNLKDYGLNIRFMLFGFDSIEDMESWFPIKILRDVKKYGGKIVEMQVPKRHTFKFAGQLVYYPRDSKIIREVHY